MNPQLNISFPVHQNSIDAYKKILPELSGRRKEVYEVIKELGECTLYDIGQKLSKPYHVFSGRVTELKKTGLIIDTGVNKIINGSTFSILKIK